jgi:hypothetical protein
VLQDGVQIDLAFLAADVTNPTLDGISASIVSFFNTVNAGAGASVASRMSGVLSRAANVAQVRHYNLTGFLDGAPHGSPVRTTLFTLGAKTTAENLPSEVAIRQSLLASGWESVPEEAPNPAPPPANIRPRARYRGGFYLGPVTTLTESVGPTTEPRVEPAFVSLLDEAWFRFMDERGGDFAVWSRADEVLRLIAPGGLIRVDNAYDTIRRRGPKATTRTTVWP